jgi:trans-2,3-dihydro-3-hydroxyanthranilate isomerase
MERQFYQVDVFTSERFGGNPLAVFVDGDGIDGAIMQKIAREMNLSETTFVLRPTSASAAVRLRIFTPGRELPFAGHPTLGTAFVLHSHGRIRDERFTFEMPIGLVNVHKDGEAFWMEAPVPQGSQPVCRAADAAQVLGLPAARCVQDPAVFGAGLHFLMVLLDSAAGVDAIAGVDRKALASVTTAEVANGDILAFSYSDGRAYARMFAHPDSGIVEDPATGSSVAPLCLALSTYGVLEPAVTSIVVEQGVKMGRPSFLHARFAHRGETVSNITVGGCSVPVLHGVLQL